MVGILLGYLVSYLYIEEVGGWRSMYGISILPAVALGIGMVRTLFASMLYFASRLVGRESP